MVKEKMAEAHKHVTRQLFAESVPSTSYLSPTKSALPDVAVELSPSGYFTSELIQTTTDASVQACVSIKSASTQTGRMTLMKTGRFSPSSTSTSDSPVPGTSSDYTPSKSQTKSASSDYVAPHAPRMETTVSLIEQNSRFYLGLPPECYKLLTILTETCHIPYRNILIILKKLRLNDAFVRLGHDFDISQPQVSRIFSAGVPKLAGELQDLIFWPKSIDVNKLLPLSFRARFSGVESIIDCLEIEIARPSDALRQAMTWSQYKGCNTLKYLISATPNGTINFISGGYGGRITDNEICKVSGYFDCLPKGALVMADRGFKHIDSLLHSKGCKLIRPPSVTQGEKLSKSQVLMNKRIASLRVHIERVIRRVREFSICEPHACIHPDILYLMNYIIIIVCAIVNLQGPLIK